MSSAYILTVNCGSSSLKFALLADGECRAEGLFERLGTIEAAGKCRVNGTPQTRCEIPGGDHERALTEAVRLLEETLGKPLPVAAVGHRVVHGGEYFSAATLIDDDVLAKIELCSDLAPLHNPANALGIRVARKIFPGVPHVGVFDTAFHQTMPRHAWCYAIPFEMYERHAVRRYGFHGTSHAYVAEQAACALGRPLSELHLITAHLGNGCSACAIREGESVDTSMGLTPLEGLMMGTRSGDVDPNIQPYLQRVAGMTAEEVNEMLNRRSGLIGVSGVSNDMRTVMAAADQGNERAHLAIDMFCYRLAKGILALAAGLDRIDALVFTGGIGENSGRIRARTLDFLGLLRPELDEERNARHGAGTAGLITRETSALTCLVIRTNEEAAIAASTDELLNAQPTL